jgi:hypothetical protein
VKIELDEKTIVARAEGRDGWLREARRQLHERRRCQVKPIARSRADRLLESDRRLQQDLAVERHANKAYEHYRARTRHPRPTPQSPTSARS